MPVVVTHTAGRHEVGQLIAAALVPSPLWDEVIDLHILQLDLASAVGASAAVLFVDGNTGLFAERHCG